MTRDDIIRMAREAGFIVRKDCGFDEIIESDNWHIQTELVERFARLVAAAEREACAKEVEDEIKRVKPVYSVAAENALKAIRARGEK